MPVVLIVTSRTWTSVNATELNDHILNDGVFEGPTYITRDELGIPPGEMNLYKSLNVHCVRDQTYSTSLKVATVLSRFSSYGYRIISQAGSGVGTSGKARYSADVSVTDYRWVWTLLKEDLAPPPYGTPPLIASMSGVNYSMASSMGPSGSEKKYPLENGNGKK